MDLLTLSDLFDTRLITLEGGVQKDEYEKSLYLTRAQDIYYDAILDEFDVTNTISEKVASLIAEVERVTSDIVDTDSYGGKVVNFEFPVRKILRERVVFTSDITTAVFYRGKQVQVKEDRLSEIENSLNNPFRTPSLDFINRVIKDSEVSFTNISVHLPPNTTIGKYIATVATEPYPIILQDLPEGLEIRGEHLAPTFLQFKDKDLDKILEIAVSLVLKDMGISSKDAGNAGQATGAQS